ncbi:MAG: dihydropteroate synthase [Gemmatimonadetes bacterium]|nr:dihydropteroate synthase [Gemmatimonadota bacterium]
MTQQAWRIRGGELVLDRPVILGILNVTPDSFSDGGDAFSPAAWMARAEALVAGGADVIDVGGESTRPGASPVFHEEELARVVPVVAAIRERWPAVAVSIDTVKGEVASAAIAAGAHIVNDVSGFRLDPAMGDICAATGVGVVLMHSRGSVGDMASHAHAEYEDVVMDVRRELAERVREAREAGVREDAIVVDPGLGFGKRRAHSVSLIAAAGSLSHRPVLVGASRKRFIGEITGVTDAWRRDAGSVGAHVAALAAGARLFRVHDVAMHRHALDVAWEVLCRR